MIQCSIGHPNTDLLQKHIHSLGTKSLQIQRISQQLPIDPGDTATMQSRHCNTGPSTKPKAYSEIWHTDIGFGPCAAIGGIHYTLMMVNKCSQFKFVYGLKTWQAHYYLPWSSPSSTPASNPWQYKLVLIKRLLVKKSRTSSRTKASKYKHLHHIVNIKTDWWNAIGKQLFPWHITG